VSLRKPARPFVPGDRNVHGKGKIEIKKDGSVNGDLTTAQIIIEDGAHFKGSIEIVRKIDARSPGDKVPGKL